MPAARYSACSEPWVSTSSQVWQPSVQSILHLVATFALYRAWTSCNLWELSVDDVLRMRSLQPGMLDDIAEHFVQTASRLLRGMDATRL
jgi:hypothetical protein